MIAFTRVAARLPCQDLARARAWYGDILGLEPAEERPGGLRYLVADSEFALYQSAGAADGSFTQMALEVADIDAAVAALKARGAMFEDYDEGPLATTGGIATVAGQYPGKGTGERAAWLRDSEGNLIGLGQVTGPAAG